MPYLNELDNDWIDGTLYPDVDPPTTISTLGEQIDFLARLCSAWDFGVLPYSETIEQIRRDEWRKAVDSCNLLTSPLAPSNSLS